MPEPLDPVALTAALVRCPSVTPADAGALDTLADALTPFGFRATRIDRGGIANLYLRYGEGGPVLGFNGHTDVVPVGDEAAWTYPPFSATIADGQLWGRGALDMKSGVAAFAAAAARWAAGNPSRGSVALLITGDEEAVATDGTVAILDWMEQAGERLDFCIVGEPTSQEAFGDTIKIGRRGSITTEVTVKGTQGHVAYPARTRNPAHALVRLLDGLASTALDEGSAHFEPSSLQVTTIDIGNPADNVVPANAFARFNIRFNDGHSADSLAAMIRERAAAVAAAFEVAIDLRFRSSADSFVTEPGPFVETVTQTIARQTNRAPALSTGGGTSDARFVKNHCPVVEVGLLGKAAHGVDERVAVEDIHRLADLYHALIEGCLGG
jgi:succinyl-diaminopimelate desuccinylase